MDALQDAINRIVFEELDVVTRPAIAENAIKEDRYASGRTNESMHTEENPAGATLYGRRYFGTLETGRKPGKVPYQFREIIRQWSIDKGISFATERERNSFSYLVAKKIKEEGTELYRLGGDEAVFTEPIKKSTESIKEKIAGLVSEFIVESLVKEVK